MTSRKETHIWFSQNDDEVQIESRNEKLNAAVYRLARDEPDAVDIIIDEDGVLRCSVKKKNLTFRTIRTLTEKTKRALSENGKRNSKNLKYSK